MCLVFLFKREYVFNFLNTDTRDYTFDVKRSLKSYWDFSVLSLVSQPEPQKPVSGLPPKNLPKPDTVVSLSITDTFKALLFGHKTLTLAIKRMQQRLLESVKMLRQAWGFSMHKALSLLHSLGLRCRACMHSFLSMKERESSSAAQGLLSIYVLSSTGHSERHLRRTVFLTAEGYIPSGDQKVKCSVLFFPLIPRTPQKG